MRRLLPILQPKDSTMSLISDGRLEHRLPEVPSDDHVLRHVTASAIDGDFVDPSAYRLKTLPGGTMEEGLSVNWAEYFKKATLAETVPLVVTALEGKGRTIRRTHKLAGINVGRAVAAASAYVAIRFIKDPEPKDPSHALV